MKKYILTTLISLLMVLASFNNTGINAQSTEPDKIQPPKILKDNINIDRINTEPLIASPVEKPETTQSTKPLKDRIDPVKINTEPLIIEREKKPDNKIVETIKEQEATLSDPLRQLELDLVFRPNKDIIEIQPSLKDKIEVVNLTSTDNQKLKVWYIAPKNGKDTVLYTHGNKVNMTTKQNVAEFLSNNGYGVLMADYRGYGYNDGTPTEQGMYDDATTALNYLNIEKGIKTKDLLLWGHSLGGGVASQLASTNTFKGVILNNTFTSIEDMARVSMIKGIQKSDLPLKDVFMASTIILPKTTFLIIKPRFDNINKVSKIESPLLILSSEEDEVIPYIMSVELANKQPKAKFVLSATGAHSALKWLEPVVLEFFNSIK